MHLKGLDLNLLIVLDKLLVEKNVTRTGELIHLSQSATSGALSRLREYFDDPLLIQVGRGMELTPFAQHLSENIHDIVRRCESVIESNKSFDPETSSRTFRINVSDSTASVLFNPIVKEISLLAPNVTLEVSAIVDEPINEYLEKGYLDLIITPNELTSPKHPSEHLYMDELVCVCCKENVSFTKEITREQYKDNKHIITNFSRSIGRSLDDTYIARAGVQRKVALVVPSFSVLVNQIIGTEYIATIQKRFAESSARYYPIKMFACPFNTPKIEMRQQWHTHSSNDHAIIWLRKIIQKHSQKLGYL
ncbi:transcriptional regulator [Vibrio cholerae]|uniref:LysR family transcriptional regulator n=1 Tax=Vibrio cholerae TaxID=666 RepID=UPI0011DB9967|nr:LysR family transcriptional regulator [Vibrio cholerae]TXX90521.1 LysR family transcriptional regulator [Vibrio cholerae]GHW45564.1 transcriptional regulator [Vibrio cholerae]